MVSEIVLWILCGIAIVQDIAVRKITNRFNLISAAIALVCVIVTGERNISEALIGFFAALFLGFVMWGVGAVKAGDSKFMWTIGLLKGVKSFGISMLIAILTGGVMAVGIILKKKDLKRRFSRVGNYLKNICLTKSYSRYEAEDAQEAPFSVPLAIGCVLEYVWRYWKFG